MVGRLRWSSSPQPLLRDANERFTPHGIVAPEGPRAKAPKKISATLWYGGCVNAIAPLVLAVGLVAASTIFVASLAVRGSARHDVDNFRHSAGAAEARSSAALSRSAAKPAA